MLVKSGGCGGLIPLTGGAVAILAESACTYQKQHVNMARKKTRVRILGNSYALVYVPRCSYDLGSADFQTDQASQFAAFQQLSQSHLHLSFSIMSSNTAATMLRDPARDLEGQICQNLEGT